MQDRGWKRVCRGRGERRVGGEEDHVGGGGRRFQLCADPLMLLLLLLLFLHRLEVDEGLGRIEEPSKNVRFLHDLFYLK